jgi:hypothetical protein
VQRQSSGAGDNFSNAAARFARVCRFALAYLRNQEMAFLLEPPQG